MRLILLNKLLRLQHLPDLPEDLVAFYCFEEYSVGPLAGWPDPERFTTQRADFWAACPGRELPDGTDMPYFVWHQLLPKIDMQALINIPEDDWPTFHEFDTALPQATRIEIWTDDSPADLLWRAFVVADLIRRGIDPALLSLCVMEMSIYDRGDATHWAGMLLDSPDHAVAAEPVTPAMAAHLARLWQAVCVLPAPPEATLLSDEATRRLFRVMQGRFPDPATGLTAAQSRLLRQAGTDWVKMARLIGDAMAAGIKDADEIGDSFLQMELHHLAQADPPMVEIAGSGPMRHCKVRLTAAGLDLRGKLLDA